MLDDTLKSQLAAYLERVTLPIEIVASLGEDDNSVEMRDLLQTIQSLRAAKAPPKQWDPHVILGPSRDQLSNPNSFHRS